MIAAQPLYSPSSPYFSDTPSVRGKLWRMASDPAVGDIQRMAQAYNLPEMVAGLLVARGVAFDGVEGFLNPSLRAHFPDPARLKDMDKAAGHLADAIQSGKKIGLFVDFDVDGATSGAILARFLRAAGAQGVEIYVPDRLNEGYGPNARAFEILKERGCHLVVVADCGITSHVPLQHAADIGLQMIVVDHHEPEETLPTASAIVNPKRRDCTSGYTMMAACALSFLLCVATNARLREQGYYAARAEPLLREMLDLVALGTVCDMAPLTGANRLFIRHGFAQMANTRHAGLKALFTVSKITTAPEPFHAGFLLGPRINAGGRIHESDLGVRLLSTDDEAEAMRIAWLLDDCNTERRQMQKDMLAQAVALVHAHGFDGDAGLVLDDPEWHPGLVGLIAGDLKERFGRPACAIAFTDSSHGGMEGRGSGRSVNGINIAQAFIQGREQGLLVKGGGHAMAGGFTVMPDKVADFRRFFVAQIERQRSAMPTHPVLDIDGSLPLRAFTPQLAGLLNRSVGPYGVGHAEPVFIVRDVLITSVDTVGTNHVRCMLRDPAGGATIKAIAFKAGDGPLGTFLKSAATGSRMPVTLAGTVQLNVWQGRESAEFQIMDAR